VKWKYFGEEHNSWAKWKNNLCYNTICHAYCMANGMKSLVSKKYRREADDDED
jgi:hypothetical protein